MCLQCFFQILIGFSVYSILHIAYIDEGVIITGGLVVGMETVPWGIFSVVTYPVAVKGSWFK